MATGWLFVGLLCALDQSALKANLAISREPTKWRSEVQWIDAPAIFASSCSLGTNMTMSRASRIGKILQWHRQLDIPHVPPDSRVRIDAHVIDQRRHDSVRITMPGNYPLPSLLRRPCVWTEWVKKHIVGEDNIKGGGERTGTFTHGRVAARESWSGPWRRAAEQTCGSWKGVRSTVKLGVASKAGHWIFFSDSHNTMLRVLIVLMPAATPYLGIFGENRCRKEIFTTLNLFPLTRAWQKSHTLSNWCYTVRSLRFIRHNGSSQQLGSHTPLFFRYDWDGNSVIEKRVR